MFFLQARESFVITTGVDTKLGSAPKSKVGISRTGDREAFFFQSCEKDLAVFLGAIETIGKVTGFLVKETCTPRCDKNHLLKASIFVRS